MRELIDAFRRGGGTGKKLALQVHLSWASSDDEARQLAHRNWRSNIVPPEVAELLRMPAQFEVVTATLRPEDMEGHVLMSSDPDRYVQALEEYRAMGFEEIYLHNVGPNQQQFLETFGRDVLPKVLRTG